MKTILVTGSTDGIGRATARELAQRGCAVIVHGRNQQRADAATNEVAATTGNQQVTADFASLPRAREMAQQVRARCWTC